MAGWYLDVVIGYLIRTLTRFFKMRRSKTWPIEKAEISSVSPPKFEYGGPCGEFLYTYTHKGEYYSGIHRKAFMLRSSAQDYTARHLIGEVIAVRVNPAEPEISIVAIDD